MLIAIYRANEDAFIRKNVNLLRTGRILDIPGAETVSTIDPEEAKRLVQAHMDDFAAYRSRLATASTSVEAPGGRREAEGKIEPKPEAPAVPKAKSTNWNSLVTDLGLPPIEEPEPIAPAPPVAREVPKPVSRPEQPREREREPEQSRA